MPAFSFSAPAITKEDERRELASLDQTEREKIHADVYGLHEEDETSDGGLDPELLADMIQDLKKQIELLPHREKTVYEEARRVASDVVEAETDYAGFLRVENGNVTKAAKRVVQHWHHRMAVFGPELAYLPMTVDGAIAKDADLLKLGLAHILPTDNRGRAVMFWDRTRYTSRVASHEAMWRVLWFCFASIGKCHSEKKNEYVLIVNGRVSCLLIISKGRFL